MQFIPGIPNVAISVVFQFFVCIVAALLIFVIPDPARIPRDPADMRFEDVGEFRVSIRVEPPLRQWRVLLMPATYFVTVPLRYISFLGADQVGETILPRLIPIVAIWAILYMWGKTGREILTIGGGKLALSWQWLNGWTIWRTEFDLTRIATLRYELDLGPSLAGGIRTIAIRRTEGRTARFGNGLTVPQAQDAIEKIGSQVGLARDIGPERSSSAIYRG
jgi:hypothetical protein